MRWRDVEKTRRRAIGVVGLVVLMVAGLSVAAVAAIGGAVQISRTDKKFEVVRTFDILVPAGSGVPGGAEPSDDASNWPSVEWQAGEVAFTTSFLSVEPEPGVYSFQLVGPRIANHGPDPVTVVTKGDLIAYTESEGWAYVPDVSRWLAPGDVWGGDFGSYGEVFNTGDATIPRTTAETADGQVLPIAILAEGGATGTGAYGWSFYYDEAERMGHFVFTLQLRGTT
ncbi:MAG TPA: hypothetical protein VFO65_00190 [Acidimicrobiales bacterium]|nr:hypothetical protein [Acidimicrobiales bacterium]